VAKTLGERLRELREAQDFTLRELAQKLKVSAAFLSDVELGRRYLSKGLLKRIAATLKTSADDLCKYDTRAPIVQLKRLAATNPAFGIALRTAADNPDEFLEFLKSRKQASKR
jgi:transcriptional regulator with XRE-family HTH domain